MSRHSSWPDYVKSNGSAALGSTSSVRFSPGWMNLPQTVVAATGLADGPPPGMLGRSAVGTLEGRLLNRHETIQTRACRHKRHRTTCGPRPSTAFPRPSPWPAAAKPRTVRKDGKAGTALEPHCEQPRARWAASAGCSRCSGAWALGPSPQRPRACRPPSAMAKRICVGPQPVASPATRCGAAPAARWRSMFGPPSAPPLRRPPFSGLTNGTRYAFEVRAVSALGAGAAARVWAALATSPSAAVTISDAALRGQIDIYLSKSAGETITQLEMANMSTLVGEAVGISSLSGLEYALNLRSLHLQGNSISDLSALSGLLSLGTLSLARNSITDLSPLSNLTTLRWLTLSENSISDISALTNLTALRYLHLWQNQISDISALSGLTSLTALFLHRNSISDISALSNMTALRTLNLSRNNSISDISSLSGLTVADHVELADQLHHQRLAAGKFDSADVASAGQQRYFRHLHIVELDGDAAGCTYLTTRSRTSPPCPA